MKITIKRVGKPGKEIEVDGNLKLADLRIVAGTATDVPSDQIKFLFNGGVLTDNTKTLTELGIKESDSIGVLKQVTPRNPATTTPQAPAPTAAPSSAPSAPTQGGMPQGMPWGGFPGNMGQQLPMNEQQLNSLMNSDMFKNLTQVLQSNPNLITKLMQMQQQGLNPETMANQVMQDNPEIFSAITQSLSQGGNPIMGQTPMNPSTGAPFQAQPAAAPSAQAPPQAAQDTSSYLSSKKETYKEEFEQIQNILGVGTYKEEDILEALEVSDGDKGKAINYLMSKAPGNN